MIFARIEDISDYIDFEGLNDSLEFVRSQMNNFSAGSIAINDMVYIKVMEYDTKVHPDIIESHREEVDIQISLSGSEYIDIYDFQNVKVSRPYDLKDDCVFYEKNGLSVARLNLVPNYFAVFFSSDIHNPQGMLYDERIKKVVIKVNKDAITRKK